jgi:hypothetical protein
MYSTNGSFIKVHSKHHRHKPVALIGLRDEFDDESSTIEEDEDINTNNSKVDLIVSDFTDENGNPRVEREESEKEKAEQAQ